MVDDEEMEYTCCHVNCVMTQTPLAMLFGAFSGLFFASLNTQRNQALQETSAFILAGAIAAPVIAHYCVKPVVGWLYPKREPEQNDEIGPSQPSKPEP